MIFPVVDLSGKHGLVGGVANAQSIAAGCAHAFRRAGAELAITYRNDKRCLMWSGRARNGRDDLRALRRAQPWTPT